MRIKWDIRTTDVLIAFITTAAIPWVTWSTNTLFQVKQDIALIKVQVQSMSSFSFFHENPSLYVCKNEKHFEIEKD